MPARELQPKTRVMLVQINWWTVLDQRQYFEDLGDHAGELETSVMQHLVPDLVLPLGDAGSGRERKPKIAGVVRGMMTVRCKRRGSEEPKLFGPLSVVKARRIPCSRRTETTASLWLPFG